MYIEDIVDKLAGILDFLDPNPITVDPADQEILFNLWMQVSSNVGYTEKQRALTLKLIYKYREELLSKNIDANLELVNPTYKLPLRVLSTERSINIDVTDGLSSRYIIVKFPYNDNIIKQFKEYKASFPYDEQNTVSWNSDIKAWCFDLDERHIKFISGFLDYGFDVCEEFSYYLEQIKKIEQEIEKYIPIVVYEDGKFSFKNTTNAIPQPVSSDLIEVMMQARNYGITVWDEAIDLALAECSPVIYKFFTPSKIRPHATSLNLIEDIIEYSKSILVVIPGGTELDHLRYTHQFFIKKGCTPSQMSAMFRLDSSSGRTCNEYIKENKINNPIANNTRVVFVSGKIPKPIIESGKEFDLIIHYGTNSAHYTLQSFVKRHHNVINLSLSFNKDKDIGNM